MNIIIFERSTLTLLGPDGGVGGIIHLAEDILVFLSSSPIDNLFHPTIIKVRR